MTARRKTRFALVAVACAALLSACGSDGSSSNASSTGQKTKPTVTVPSAPAPADLQSKDLIVGTGAEAKNGSTVTVQYVGANYADGKQFDTSWDRGQPFVFQLGGGSVIEGWDQGVVGMKVGGRRQLIIPPSLGYGAQAQGPIKANETLLFVIDLISVK